MAEWYWPGLLAAGVAQVIDGVFLYKARGRINTGSAISGGIEFGWLLVSVFALVTGRIYGPQVTAAIAYISYNLAGLVQGILLLKRQNDIDSFAVPPWMVMFSIAVGCLFALVALANIMFRTSL